MFVGFRTHNSSVFTAHGRSHSASDSIGGLPIRGTARREDNPGHSGEYALLCCNVLNLFSRIHLSL
jgi:hypothetical protein